MRGRRALVILLALCAVTCAAACGGGAKGASDGRSAAPSVPSNAPVVVAARVVCRLAADNAGARLAGISGLDGAPSVVVDGTSYWFFGDTVVNRAGGGGQDVIPSAVATSTDTDGSDCAQLN